MRIIEFILALVCGLALLPVSGPLGAESGAANYIPIIQTGASPSSGCSNPSGEVYESGMVFQYDEADPIQPAEFHADKNFAVRGYERNDDPDLQRELVDYGSDDRTRPPQLATIFQPARANLRDFYQVHKWSWADDSRGELKTQPPVTALGLATTPGETLRVPTSGYDIGGGMEVVVLFADEDTIALHYTREDTVALGYTIHIDNLCTDPALLALYNSLDAANGPRYDYVGPSNSYPLPNLPAGAHIGTARGDEIVVAIVDSGSHMDPRSCNEWWQIRPGYTGSCPPAAW